MSKINWKAWLGLVDAPQATPPLVCAHADENAVLEREVRDLRRALAAVVLRHGDNGVLLVSRHEMLVKINRNTRLETYWNGDGRFVLRVSEGDIYDRK